MSELLTPEEQAALAAMEPPPSVDAQPEPTIEEVAAMWRENLAHVLVLQGEVADEYVSKRRLRVIAKSALDTCQAMYVQALTQAMDAMVEQEAAKGEPQSLIIPHNQGIQKP